MNIEKLIKMEKKLKKISRLQFPDYNLLKTQDLWQVHYQILLIILLKEFIKVKVNTDMMINNMKLAELSAKIVSAVLNT